MDDTFEQPTASIPRPAGTEDNGDDEELSGEEDGGLDWTKLQPARPVIPKRGEKDFEPKPGGGSGLQVHVLDRARNVMFETLRATRTISSKAVSYAIWYPNIGRSHVTLAKGIHFSSMGHSAPREIPDETGAIKLQKRLELLPEETIYLVERGSLFCWKDCSTLPSSVRTEQMEGAPMSVEQVYAEMIGVDDLTMEKLQVYTYLKRLGYSVTRANPPTSYYPVPPSKALQSSGTQSRSVFSRMFSIFPSSISRLYRIFWSSFNWWRPLRISRWLHHDKNYASIFKSLRFIPSTHTVPLSHPKQELRQRKKAESPYKIFYNLYKPNTSLKRSAPPEPDFQIVVVNARTTPMPTLQELTDLFDELPELPPPLPRQRRPLPTQGDAKAATKGAVPSIAPTTTAAAAAPPPNATAAPPPAPKPSLIRRLFPWAFKSPAPVPTEPVRRPHPFMALKTGKKIIIIAAVDSGSISFFRFGQGDFTEWPMV